MPTLDTTRAFAPTAATVTFLKEGLRALRCFVIYYIFLNYNIRVSDSDFALKKNKINQK